MANLPSPNAVSLKSELTRLYKRRLVIDELIRTLERYAASEARIPAAKAKKLAEVVNLRHIA